MPVLPTLLEYAPILRTVVLAILLISIGFTASVCLLYARALRIAPRKMGLLPWHVVAVSAGTLQLQGGLAWAQVDALSGNTDPAHVMARLGIFGTGSLTIFIALAIMATLQRRKVQFSRQATVEVSSTTSAEVHSDEPATDVRR